MTANNPSNEPKKAPGERGESAAAEGGKNQARPGAGSEKIPEQADSPLDGLVLSSGTQGDSLKGREERDLGPDSSADRTDQSDLLLANSRELAAAEQNNQQAARAIEVVFPHIDNDSFDDASNSAGFEEQRREFERRFVEYIKNRVDEAVQSSQRKTAEDLEAAKQAAEDALRRAAEAEKRAEDLANQIKDPTPNRETKEQNQGMSSEMSHALRELRSMFEDHAASSRAEEQARKEEAARDRLREEPGKKNGREAAVEQEAEIQALMQEHFPWFSKTPAFAAEGTAKFFTPEDRDKWLRVPNEQAEARFEDQTFGLKSARDALEMRRGSLSRAEYKAQAKELAKQEQELAEAKESFVKDRFGQCLQSKKEIAKSSGYRWTVPLGALSNVATVGAAYFLGQTALSGPSQAVLLALSTAAGYGASSLFANFHNEGNENSLGRVYEAALSAASWSEKLARTGEVYAMVDYLKNRSQILPESLNAFSMTSVKSLWNHTAGLMFRGLRFDLTTDKNSTEYVLDQLRNAGKVAGQYYFRQQMTAEQLAIQDRLYDQAMRNVEKQLQTLRERHSFLSQINETVARGIMVVSSLTAVTAFVYEKPIFDVLRSFLGY